MSNQRTIDRIMDAVGIKPKQIYFIEKVLELESDNKRIHSVKLHHGTMDCFRLWAEVNLLENFRNLSEFAEYLADKGLSSCKVSMSRDKSTYFSDNEGIRLEFKKKEVYSYQ